MGFKDCWKLVNLDKQIKYSIKLLYIKQLLQLIRQLSLPRKKK